MYLLIIMLVFVHIKRNAQLEESWLGRVRDTHSNRLMNAVLFGMIVGIAASFLIVLIGITLDTATILFIWPLALFLMLFNQRYLCFSYAGGIVSLISLLFGWPDIDVSGIIALVGILHLIESLLIVLDGHRGSLPVFMEHKRFKPVGAFILNRLWPIPLVMLVVPAEFMQASAGGGVTMPDWWPLFQVQSSAGGLVLFPLAAILGYGDIAITQSPLQRSRKTGIWLGAYSAAILVLAVVSSHIYWLKYVAAVLTPVLHELLIFIGKRGQLEGKPAFGAPWRGLRILEVFPDSPAERMGLRSGDILMNVNGKPVNSEEMLRELLSGAPSYVWIDAAREKQTINGEYKDFVEGVKQLGAVIVPRQTGRLFLPQEQQGLAIKFLKRLAKKHNGKKTTSST